MFYGFVKAVLKIFFCFVFRIKAEGKENVTDGGLILAVNHRSNWDALVVAVSCPRQMAFMAKSELFKLKLADKFLKALGAFPVHRGKGDIGAVKTALTILKGEKAMIMFPEGTRVKEGETAEIKPGVVMLATRAKVPVVPVLISGKYKWFGKITVSFGPAIYLDEYYGEKLSVEKMQNLSESIMDNIHSLTGGTK